MKNKEKIISLMVIFVISISVIGYVAARSSSSYEFEGDSHGGCHDNLPLSKTPIQSVNASIYSNSAYTEPGISVSIASPYVGQTFSVSIYIGSFTEANNVSDGRRTAGYSGNVTVQISEMRGNNSEFNIPNWEQEKIVLDGEGNSSAVTFYLDAPSTVGKYNLTIDAISATNWTGEGGDGDDWWSYIIYAWASVNITVGARPLGLPGNYPKSNGGDDEPAVIPGYVSIITLASIFAVSAILILKMKKLQKRKRQID